MTLTVTDLFCGAGGSSLGAVASGCEIVMAANHWSTAIDVHQANFPDADHDCADVSQADPRRYPKTDLLLASPECTNHSQARGIARSSQQAGLFDEPDPAAVRSRATMWDVVRFAEQLRYDAMIVENVVEATKWVLWPAWCKAVEDLGYSMRVVSMNSMHHGVPQSRDRIYVACWRKGLAPDLELELSAHCSRCDRRRACRQGWNPGRTSGRYGQQYRWHCVDCSARVEPDTEPAASILDWSLPCPPFGSKHRADKTRDRLRAGLERHGWLPITTAGAGNTYETTPGNRARPISEPLPVQQGSSTTALAVPQPFLMHTNHAGRTYRLDAPHPTVCASDDRAALILPMRNHGQARPVSDPLPAVTAGGNHHALLMRNNRGGAEMVTPVTEPARTMTGTAAQSLLTPRHAHDVEAAVDACGFRMLEPHEIAAAMAFPEGYIPSTLPKKDRVKLAGNAVTPPVMTWLTGRMAQAIEAR